jgi:NodT family efflux transporter outer membrane factor (OMF) lipoprotein
VNKARLLPLALVAALLAAGCTAFQPERRPEKPLELPSAWQQPQPGTASAAAVFPAKWWSAFGDPRLDALVDQALQVNNDLAAAGIRVQRAQLQAGLADTNLTPGVVGQAATNRGYDLKRGGVAGSSSSSLVTLSYELDLWGRLAAVRSAADWELKATQSDRQATALALVATTANLYWQTGYLNQRIALSEAGMEDARRIVALVRARYEAGAVSGLDVAQQQALLETTLTQVDVLKKQRAQYEHALATLTGTPAPSFALATDLREIRPPAVPLGVPSDVLERRPDVASAERAMAAANAQIGVATAAFYPSILIAPTVGVDSRLIESLFDAPSLLWSVGVSATQVLFDGGQIENGIQVLEGYLRHNPQDSQALSLLAIGHTACENAFDVVRLA